MERFDDLPDRTAEVASQFEVLRENWYISRLRNACLAQDDVMACDCSPEIDGQGANHACGPDSQCINRFTNIECTNEDCGCGEDCRNQRFQRCEYANTSIFLTEKKGYGMRANEFIPANTFLIEYIGDIIDQQEYKVRKDQYQSEGLKHFYFMMIQDDEIIDATKRASMARYCNHSCDPNAYVDKWIVNKRFKMGIFAKKDIQKGEEICFDYNVDRYGADPQPCYCGASNCIGVLGGKTQSESVRLLPHSITEALGVVPSAEKRWIKEQKSNGVKITKDNLDSNVNVEFVKALELSPLDLDDVPKVASCLIQPELDLIVISRILERISLDEETFNDIVKIFARMHGLKAIGSSVKVLLDSIKDDQLNDLQLNILAQILKILSSWPPLKTKNAIQASNLEESFQKLVKIVPDDVKAQLLNLLNVWADLKIEYRIPKRPKSENSTSSVLTRERSVVGDKKPSPSARSLSNNSAAWSHIKVSDLPASRVVDNIPLPGDWEWAMDPSRNKIYYFSRSTGKTTWDKPEWENEDSKRDEEKRKRREMERQQSETQRIKTIELQRKRELIEASKEVENRKKHLSDIIKQAQMAKEAEQAKQREEEEREKKRLEKRQKAKLEREIQKASHQPKSEPKKNDSSKEKKWVALFAMYVPHMLKKYEEFIGRDNLKSFARDISHMLAVKELQRHGADYDVPKSLTEERKNKVKLFAKNYTHRQIEKMKGKKRKDTDAKVSDDKQT